MLKRSLVIFISLLAIALFSLHAQAQSTGGEAICIRIIPNPQRLSPLAWYHANVPNPGTTTPLSLDGYPAVRDGRTVYVAGTNYDPQSKILYSNIYLLSHSETARAEVRSVFEEFLNQFKLNTNIQDQITREQLRRDMSRATDISTMRSLLETYRSRTAVYTTVRDR